MQAGGVATVGRARLRGQPRPPASGRVRAPSHRLRSRLLRVVAVPKPINDEKCGTDFVKIENCGKLFRGFDFERFLFL